MAVTIANMSGIPMDFSFYVMLIIVVTISSLDIAGIAAMAVSVKKLLI